MNNQSDRLRRKAPRTYIELAARQEIEKFERPEPKYEAAGP